MWKLVQLRHFIRHFLTGKRPGQMHSPYLFRLLPVIHDERRHDVIFDKIEALRRRCLNDPQPISVTDYGAGSQRLPTGRSRTISQIAGTALSTPARCRMLFRLLAETRPKTVLELGTSLGIMTQYLAAHNPACAVHTIEGNPQLTKVAACHAAELGLNNIHFHTGTFREMVPQVCETIGSLDFAYIDGDHKGTAVLGYLDMLMSVMSEDGIIVLDDIRWSRSMYEAWKTISDQSAIPCCLDYFSFGVIFLRKAFKAPVRQKIYCGMDLIS